MRLIRSFPAELPAGRNYVVDDAPRLLNRDQDYRGLIDLGDDVLHLDWDVAVHREDLVRFAALARSQPGRVLVAPYLIYPSPLRHLPAPVWSCKRYLPGEQSMRVCTPQDESAHLFGFGMVYLPGRLLKAFGEVLGSAAYPKFDDMGFSAWHYNEVEREAPLTWAVHPVHLHCRASEVLL